MRKITLKKMRNIALAILFTVLPGFVLAQTEINTEAGLRGIAQGLGDSYKLTADIHLTEDWTPIDNFSGTLDGNGFIIYGLKFNYPETNKQGLFATTNGATIKNLGVEKANVVGKQDVGAFVGAMSGGLIEACYISDSYVEGADHVGSILGKITGGGIIQNCYSTARSHSRGAQAGGLVGILDNATMDKCYFSGIVSNSGRSCGMVSMIEGNTNNNIKNSVLLAPYVLGGITYRIVDRDNKTTTLENNYSLSTTKVGSTVENAVVVSIENENYGVAGTQGANIPTGEEKTQAFYAGLNWDFTNTWVMNADAYPTLKWQKKPIKTNLVIPAGYNNFSLAKSGKVDLNYVFSGHGLTITYSSTNANITISEGVVTLTGNIMNEEDAIINLVIPNTTNFSIENITIKLIPDIVYSISTPEQLLAVSDKLAANYRLANDIDMTGIDFPCLGSSTDPFTGIFDGNGHVIRGLKHIDANKRDRGLFAKTKNATIKKLGIEDAYFVGNEDIGAVVGYMEGGVIEECYVSNSYIEGRDHTGSLVGALRSDAKVQNCYSTAKVYSRDWQAGGLCGTLVDGHVLNSYFAGVVNCPNQSIAGIVSFLDTDNQDEAKNSIKNSVNLSSYLVGNVTLRIINTTGRKITLDKNYSLAGSKLGNSVSNANIVADTDANYGADKMHGANIPGGDEKAKDPDFYFNTLGWSSSVWSIAANSASYPLLAWQTDRLPVKSNAYVGLDIYNAGSKIYMSSNEQFDLSRFVPSHGQTLSFVKTNNNIDIQNNTVTVSASVTGKATAPITVTQNTSANTFDFLSQFQMVVFKSGNVIEIDNTEEMNLVAAYPMESYKLTQDIDMAGISFKGIGSDNTPFTGTFNGNGFAVKNYSVTLASNENCRALFNVISGATIKRLGLVDVNISGGNQDIGGLVGRSKSGEISRCYVSGGLVEGNDHVGAIVGGSIGEGRTLIKDCYANTVVKTRSSQVGGIIGTAKTTTITNCYFAGSVTAPTENWMKNSGGIISLLEDDHNSLSNIVSMGLITGGTTGRFIARGGNPLLDESNLIYNSDVSFTLEDGGQGTGVNLTETPKTDAELKQKATYEALGWNFNKMWKIEEGSAYPVLRLEAATDASLKSLSVVEGTISPAFESTVTAYTLSVANTVESVTVNAETNDEDATYTVTGNTSLQVGENTVTVTVTAEDEVTTKAYTIKVTRAASTDATLKSLAVTEGTIAPEFESSVVSYTLAVGNSVEALTVNAETTHAKATYAVTGDTNLQVGENTVTITVTAEDKSTTKAYTIAVTRAASLSTDATLKSLSIAEGTISPAFESTVTSYTLSVVNTVESVTVNAETTHASATYAVTGDNNLQVGENTVTITVTAEDESTTKAYKITVTRAAPLSNDATLKSLSVSEGAISPAFESTVTSYTLQVENTVEAVTVNAETNHANATLNVTGNSNLQVGPNTVTITVTAENGDTNNYIITVTRKTPVGLYVNKDMNISISTENAMIIVKFEGTHTLKLYTFTGHLLTQAVSTDEYIQSVERGAYILVVDDTAFKVLVK